MNCYECGGTFQEKTELLEVDDPYVGTIFIKGVPYYRCDKCDALLYTEEMSRAIETERNNRIQQIIKQFPISDFISASETASMLGISRQALHKNRRINHGFIYQTKFTGITVYLRISALKFKETGDGRFPLYPPASYAEVIMTKKETSFYSSLQRIKVFDQPQYQDLTESVKESVYAN